MREASYPFPVGVFWLVDAGDGQGRLVSHRTEIDPETCQPAEAFLFDHQAVWAQVQAEEASLRSFAFDHFPRGAVDFQRLGRRWLLALDAKLSNSRFIAHLVVQWHLPAGHVSVRAGAYASVADAAGIPVSSDPSYEIKAASYFGYVDRGEADIQFRAGAE